MLVHALILRLGILCFLRNFPRISPHGYLQTVL